MSTTLERGPVVTAPCTAVAIIRYTMASVELQPEYASPMTSKPCSTLPEGHMTKLHLFIVLITRACRSRKIWRHHILCMKTQAQPRQDHSPAHSTNHS